MTRSVWKGPFVDVSVLQQSMDKRIHIWSRRSVIIPQYINQQVYIYNGKTFISLVITEDMVGHKFGEFSPSRTYLGHTADKKAKRA